LKIIPASVKRLDEPLPFYSFLAAHSLLIGLLPFFLPVFLWGHGFKLADVALLISATGAGFAFNLRFWQQAAKKFTTRDLLIATFAIEALLVVALLLATVALEPTSSSSSYNFSISFLALFIGCVSGTYNAWFWTTQRTLFLAMTQASNTGRQYGNFQIFVTIFLKAGILIGGLLLESTYSRTGIDGPSISLKSSLNYKDRCRSYPVFLLDGIFLFLESHFWLLTLFLLVREDFSSLGITVVALAIFFALTFYWLKNTIDQLKSHFVYWVATGLYTLSWLSRASVDSDMSLTVLSINLMLITFCSSFFRLAFNKRFFDLARSHNNVDYLLVKSYLSQVVLAVAYAGLAIFLFQSSTDGTNYFPIIYYAAAVLSVGYAMYRVPEQ